MTFVDTRQETRVSIGCFKITLGFSILEGTYENPIWERGSGVLSDYNSSENVFRWQSWAFKQSVVSKTQYAPSYLKTVLSVSAHPNCQVSGQFSPVSHLFQLKNDCNSALKQELNMT